MNHPGLTLPPDIPGVPAGLLPQLARCAAGTRMALVGGAVRDLLLHRLHHDPWRGVPDLDLVVEAASSRDAAALRLVRALVASPGLQVHDWHEHGSFGTVEVELELTLAAAERPAGPGPGLPDPPGALILLDVATARREDYPLAAGNPQVSFGRLEEDLARRDFTINAMALLLGPTLRLLDPHGGQADLGRRQLRFLHPASVRDDPTRLLRAARYVARLGFQLAASSREQAAVTLHQWPWTWRPGDPPELAPPALGTRLRMELQLLLEREPWPRALAALQDWGALVLLDPALQADRHWRRRLLWGERLGLEPMLALLAAAADPCALASRLQLPHRQQRLLAALQRLRPHLCGDAPATPRTVAAWCQLLEAPGSQPQAVALALAAGVGPRRPLLRWWLRWRHLGPPLSAAELMEREGLRPGPALGARLRELRQLRLTGERL